MTIEEMSDKTILPFRDKDQDANDGYNCAAERKGGWWLKNCAYAHLTGHLTTTSSELSGRAQIHWYHCGDRCGGSTSWNSWKEAEMILVKKINT